MKKNGFGKTIPYLMLRDGITPSELCRKLKISRSVLDRLKKNEVDPRLSTILLLSNFFNVSLDALTGRVELDLPVHSWELLESNDSKFKEKEIRVAALHPSMNEENTQVFKVNSSAMKPPFEEGFYIYVNKQRAPVNNDFVVVVLNESKSAVLRKIQIEGKKRILVATNSVFEPIMLAEKDRVIGVVTDFYGNVVDKD